MDKMQQSRVMSIIESVTNVVSGYLIAILTQFAVFPAFGINISFTEQLGVALIFTVVSLLRIYLLRRFFNSVKG